MISKIQKVMASRRLFDNWIDLATRYVLNKMRFKVPLYAKIKKCKIKISPLVYETLVIGLVVGLIKSVECINNSVYINGIEYEKIAWKTRYPENWALLLGWRFDNNYWFKNGIKFKNMYVPILEVFEKDIYRNLNVADKVVIDIGAFVGDSAIYFALRGARKVIAVEPHPGAYGEMIENIRLNNLENKIIPVNAAVASSRGRVLIENTNIENTGGTLWSIHSSGFVEALTLGDIVDRFQLHKEALTLKMDCEGCEYDVIINNDKVDIFDEMMIEYHGNVGNPRTLLSTLDRFYICRTVEIVKRGTGVVHCVKRR